MSPGSAKVGRPLWWCVCTGVAARQERPCSDTLLVHCLTVLMSSWMTRSMHFRQGSFSLMICFFTMASNARSGVNRPVLRDATTDRHTDRWRHGAGAGHRPVLEDVMTGGRTHRRMEAWGRRQGADAREEKGTQMERRGYLVQKDRTPRTEKQ